VKSLALTQEGERLRAAFWRALTEDPGPLAPLGDPDLRVLVQILGVIAGVPGDDQQPVQASPGAYAEPGLLVDSRRGWI
jgi:hypothetical protein